MKKRINRNETAKVYQLILKTEYGYKFYCQRQRRFEPLQIGRYGSLIYGLNIDI